VLSWLYEIDGLFRHEGLLECNAQFKSICISFSLNVILQKMVCWHQVMVYQ
jgi:hypothetical protein